MQVNAFLAAATGAFTPDPDPDSPNAASARADELAHERRVPEIGVLLDMGRSVRTANRQQRRALRAMYRTCAHPDCTMPFSACKTHHIRW